jgi:hypothetical protein
LALGSNIEFIHRVREFGERVLGLDFAGSFERFDSSLGKANWLYASPVHRIESALKEKNRVVPFRFSWERERLEPERQDCLSRGLDTYLFSAEAHGAGDCPITGELLRSEKVRQCYVVLHEGWHSTLRKEGIQLPYMIEEATGRVVGNFGAIIFAKREEDPLLLARASEQERDWSRFTDYINDCYKRLAEVYEKVAEEFRRERKKSGESGSRSILTEKILQARKPHLKRANKQARELASTMLTLWETKELENTVNNAFILRYYSYTRYYAFAVKTLRDAGGLAVACARFKGVEVAPRQAGRKLVFSNTGARESR